LSSGRVRHPNLPGGNGIEVKATDFELSIPVGSTLYFLMSPPSIDDPGSPEVEGSDDLIKAVGWLRAMTVGSERGGSEPHLFATTDGEFMVKVKNNPQGPRILVNELVAGLCLVWLGTAAPRPEVIYIPQDVIDDSPGARFSNGAPLVAGLAFGSEYWQSDPDGTVDVSLLWNDGDIARTCVLDSWIRNHDGRQYRMRASSVTPGKYDFIPVDQGFCFGHRWTESILDNDRTINLAQPVRGVESEHFRQALDRLADFRENECETIIAKVPSCWLGDTERQSLARYLVERAELARVALEKQHRTGGRP
jgi:hypothetical protein